MDAIQLKFKPQLTKLTQVFNAFAFGSAGYFAIESLPLILTPKLIVSMLASEPRRITDLETYLCRSFGFALLTLAILFLLLTGAVPLGTSPVEDADTDSSSSKAIYAYPTLIVATTYYALTSFYLYSQLTYGWNFAFTVGLASSSALFCLGLWVVLFGSEKGRISKKTGADKRTGNFPFVNMESAREKKKEGKRKSVSRTKT